VDTRSNPDRPRRIAFLAEHAGRYLLESVAADWSGAEAGAIL